MEATGERDRSAPLALIVEDEALLALDIEDLLMAEGFRTLIVYTEAAARALVVEHFAVAVVNLRLAENLVGQHIIRFLRSRSPMLPVVVVTGYDGQALQANLCGLGWPTIRVHKPAHHEQLASAVWDVMGQAGSCAVPPKQRRRTGPSELA